MLDLFDKLYYIDGVVAIFDTALRGMTMQTEFIQTQELRLGQHQIQSLRLLQMNTAELEHFIEKAAQENPLIDLPEVKDALPRVWDEKLVAKWQWLNDTDFQNRAYFSFDTDSEEMDVFANIGDAGGLEMTLQRHLGEQLDRKELPKEERILLQYLLESLDEDGYLRYTAWDIMKDTGMDGKIVQHALETLKSLEPAGVCAYNLSECLALQLIRRGSSKEIICIARDHLENLAHGYFHTISLALGISEQQVLHAREEICRLNPRPGNQFGSKERSIYVVPDVYVDCVGSRYVVRSLDKENTMFAVNKYYSWLMKNTDDKEVLQYLNKKMEQVEEINWGIRQRGVTLERLSEILVDWQQDFFTKGTSALRRLSMAEVAAEMGVHVSTVSRTAKNKYLQYPGGLLPLRFFFVRGINSADDLRIGNAAVKEALKKLVFTECKPHPFSDQKLSELLTGAGYVVSRRTVAKYRDELGIPRAASRKRR